MVRRWMGLWLVVVFLVLVFVDDALFDWFGFDID
jgi:hypothetical protein